jgi:hypothetical protein
MEKTAGQRPAVAVADSGLLPRCDRGPDESFVRRAPLYDELVRLESELASMRQVLAAVSSSS